MIVKGTHSRVPTLAFGLILAAVYAVAVTIVSRLGQLEAPALIAGALTLDLTVLVPLLYYFLMVRVRGWPAITVLPVFVVSVLVAGRLIPDSQHRVLNLVEYGAILAELAIVGIVVYKTWQLRQRYREQAATGMDLYESLRESGRAVLGPVAGGALAYEVAVFYYAVAGWTKPAPDDDEAFSVYRNSGYPALLIAAMIAVVAETAGVHLLVRLWSPTAAWILTALSIYAAVWMIGDYHALRLRPTRVSEGMLHFRLGLRWALSVPLESIAKLSASAGEPPADKREHLKALLIGPPNRRIELREPVRASGFYGIARQVRTIDVQVDEPERFDHIASSNSSR